METSFIQKISKYLLIVLFVVSGVLALMFYLQVVPLGEETEQMEHGTTGLILGWTYGLFFVAAALAILAFIYGIIIDPKSSISTGIMLAGLLVVALIAYAMSSDALDSIMPTLVQTTPGELKWSDTGLYSLYIILGVAVASILGLGIYQKIR